MLKVEFIAPDIMKIVAPQKLKADDFAKIAPEFDETLKRYGTIRLLIDATHLEGWETMGAFEKHMAFVKDHEAKVTRIALITGHEWQTWLIGSVKLFVHPEVKAFDKAQADDALRWISG
jgi:hypothetical protein